MPFPQKFRAYLLDSDKAMDVLAYLLCYSLEIKDKPGKLLLVTFIRKRLIRTARTTWDVSCAHFDRTEHSSHGLVQ